MAFICVPFGDGTTGRRATPAPPVIVSDQSAALATTLVTQLRLLTRNGRAPDRSLLETFGKETVAVPVVCLVCDTNTIFVAYVKH